ncbi:hypothetical protein Tco_0121911 [Tanacetum coccineum]
MDSQRVDLLMKDRIAHQETILIVEEEAYASREALGSISRLSQAVHYDFNAREQVYTHETQIPGPFKHSYSCRALLFRHNTRYMRLAPRLQQIECRAARDLSAKTAELLALREQQRRARQPGPDVRVPDHQDASRDADSHI